jgi:hypothetical protein
MMQRCSAAFPATLMALALLAPSPAGAWSRGYGDPFTPQDPIALDVAGDGSIGFAWSSATTAFVAVADPDGAILWSHALRIVGSNVRPVITDLRSAPDGRWLACGYRPRTDPTDRSYAGFVVALAADGSPLWQVNHVPDVGWEQLLGLAVRPDGTAVAVGLVQRPAPGSGPLVLELASDGSVSRELEGSDAACSFSSVAILPDGALALGGLSTTAASSSDPWAVRLGPTGAVEWQLALGSSDQDKATRIGVAGDMVLLSALLRGSDVGPPGPWLVDIDPTGVVTRQEGLGGGLDDAWIDVPALLGSGDGSVTYVATGYDGTTVFRRGASGTESWRQVFDARIRGHLGGVARTPAGDLILLDGAGLPSPMDVLVLHPRLLTLSDAGARDMPCDASRPDTRAFTATTAVPRRTSSTFSSGAAMLEGTRLAWEDVPVAVATECDARPCLAPRTGPVPAAIDGDPCGNASALGPEPVLSWAPFPSQRGFAWAILDAAGGGMLRSGVVAADATSATPWPPLPDGAYAFRVRALGDEERGYCPGPWSATCPFAVGPNAGCRDDPAEEDDDCLSATPLCVSCPDEERHVTCDEDWFVVDARAGETLTFETSELQGGADTLLELFAADCATRLASDDDGGSEPGASRLRYSAAMAGPLYARVTQADATTATGRGYALGVVAEPSRGTSWARTLGTSGNERATGLLEMSDGSLVVLGESDGQALIARLDAGGATLWQRAVAASFPMTWALQAFETPSGLLVSAAASGHDGARVVQDAWLMALDPADGAQLSARAELWTRRDSRTDILRPEGVALLSSGRLCSVQSGIYNEGIFGSHADGLLVTHSPAGDELSLTRKAFNVGGGLDYLFDDALACVSETADGGMLLGGQGSTDIFLQRGWLMRLDAAGTLVSSVALAISAPVTRAHEVNDGTRRIAWDEAAEGTTCVAAVDDAVAQWTTCADVGPGAGMAVLPDGEVVLAGTIDHAGSRDVVVVHLDAGGSMTSARSYGGPGDDAASAVIALRDGGLLVAGSTTSFGAGGEDAWILRVDPHGGIEEPCAIVGSPIVAVHARGLGIGTQATTSQAASPRAIQPSSAAAAASALVADATCPFSGPPREVSPPWSPEPFQMRRSGIATWERAERNGADIFSMYRGRCAALRSGDAGACLEWNIPAPSTLVTEDPVADCWAYLVTARNAFGEGPMGNDSLGGDRVSSRTCP